MPFNLYRAPAAFQYYINDTLRGFLNIFYTAYIDNILIYSNLLSKYKKYIRKIFIALRNAGL